MLVFQYPVLFVLHNISCKPRSHELRSRMQALPLHPSFTPSTQIQGGGGAYIVAHGIYYKQQSL